MKDIIIFITGLILCAFFVFPASAQSGADILDKSAKSLEQAGGVTADFALHIRSDAQQLSESFEGVLHMKGDKFVLLTPDLQTWYDGKTQWSYVPRNEEVNVTEPTGEELQQINPTILLGQYKKNFTAKLKGESTAASGKTAYDVELTPKKKGDIVKVELQIEKSTSLPARIVVEEKNGARTLIQIDKLSTDHNQPDSFFVFDTNRHPEAEIIDLR